MAFVMGWSSLVYASSMPMHAQMLQQQFTELQPSTKMDNSQHQQHQAMSNAESDCHATLQNMQHHQSYKLQMDMQNSPCDRHLTSSTPIKQCADCAQLHCQTLAVWLDTAMADALPHLPPDSASNLHSLYSAQHLIGYWQEILRPPKA